MQAIVTGAEQPLGGSAVAGLRDRGHTVIGIPTPGADRAECAGLVADAIRSLGGLDTLVISGWDAAALAPQPFESLDDATFGAMWEGGMQGMLWSMQAALPALQSARGNVVVLVPTTGQSGGARYAPAASTFEGQRVLMKAAARQLGPDGVRVNAVAISPELVLADADASEVHYLAPGAIGSEPTAADVIDVVDFLVGPGGRHLTGQTLTVDGGRWLAP